MRDRLNISIEVEANNILSGMISKSSYISSIVKDENDMWRSAMSYLDANNVTGGAITAICTALSGLPKTIDGMSQESVTEHLMSFEYADEIEWKYVIGLVSDDPKFATSCAVLSYEYWRGNRALRYAIDRIDGRE